MEPGYAGSDSADFSFIQNLEIYGLDEIQAERETGICLAGTEYLILMRDSFCFKSTTGQATAFLCF